MVKLFVYCHFVNLEIVILAPCYLCANEQFLAWSCFVVFFEYIEWKNSAVDVLS